MSRWLNKWIVPLLVHYCVGYVNGIIYRYLCRLWRSPIALKLISRTDLRSGTVTIQPIAPEPPFGASSPRPCIT